MQIIGKIDGINTSDGMLNLLVNTKNGSINLKLNKEYEDKIELGLIYDFDVEEIKNSVRTSYPIKNFKKIDELSIDIKEDILRYYLPHCDLTSKELSEIINNYISKIDNKILKEITIELVNKYYDDFYTYPAAAKMHHAYVGGLAYHVVGMLKLADGFLIDYPFLDKDYLYSGIILHDIGKVKEFDGNQNTQYTVSGQLLGHISIGMIDVAVTANKLGYGDTKEVLYLCHMILSHHGQPLYGSPKKPMFAEALALSFIDNADSKFRVVGEELAKINEGELTENIGVLERQKIFKI